MKNVVFAPLIQCDMVGTQWLSLNQCSSEPFPTAGYLQECGRWASASSCLRKRASSLASSLWMALPHLRGRRSHSKGKLVSQQEHHPEHSVWSHPEPAAPSGWPRLGLAPPSELWSAASPPSSDAPSAPFPSASSSPCAPALGAPEGRSPGSEVSAWVLRTSARQWCTCSCRCLSSSSSLLCRSSSSLLSRSSSYQTVTVTHQTGSGQSGMNGFPSMPHLFHLGQSFLHGLHRRLAGAFLLLFLLLLSLLLLLVFFLLVSISLI